MRRSRERALSAAAFLQNGRRFLWALVRACVVLKLDLVGSPQEGVVVLDGEYTVFQRKDVRFTVILCPPYSEQGLGLADRLDGVELWFKDMVIWQDGFLPHGVRYQATAQAAVAQFYNECLDLAETARVALVAEEVDMSNTSKRGESLLPLNALEKGLFQRMEALDKEFRT